MDSTFTSTIQQRVTVRINYDQQIVGSGVLVLPDSRQHIYILTAKHVLWGKNFDITLDKSLIKIDLITHSDGKSLEYKLQLSDAVFASESNIEDIAIIAVKTNSIFDIDIISHSLFIETDYGLRNCIIRGFPALADYKENRSLQCQFDEYISENKQFLIHTQQSLDTTFADANANVQGLSGGGVFFNHENHSCLLGIVIQYKNVGSFVCVPITSINTILVTHQLQPLRITRLIVDEKLKATINAVNKNADTIRIRIKDTIGDFHLNREFSVTALELISENQMLLLYGSAGVGKSAVAKEVVAKLTESGDFELLLLTGEQLTKGTIDTCLSSIGIQYTIEELLASEDFKSKKVLWIESIEKAVETSQLDAFKELLEKVKGNDNIKLVVTIRNYMLQQFLFALRYDLPPSRNIQEVPLLTDEDINDIVKHFSALADLTQNQKIAHLLKIPFYLKYIVSVLPELARSQQLDEQTLKAVIWDNVIDDNTQQRGAAFEELSVKRAKEMSLFTTVNVAPEIISQLQKDDLVTMEDDEFKDRYAPSHDVLEDWALTRNIKRKKREFSGTREFISSIGNEPAIRRSFRLWLGEALQNNDVILQMFIREALADAKIESYWKDEIYVSILRSNYCDNFFQENHSLLLESDGQLTRKFIHLLRTACKEPASKHTSSKYPVLIGNGWATLVTFLSNNKNAFTKFDVAILAFLLDWESKLKGYGFDLPKESRGSGLLLLSILDRLKSNYHGNTNREPTDDYIESGILFLFKLTGAIKEEVEKFLKTAIGVVNENNNDKPRSLEYYRQRDFYEKVIKCSINSVYNDELCWHLPETLITIMTEIITPKKQRNKPKYSGYEEPKIEEHFGIQYNYKFAFSTASSIQTPICRLLKYHLIEALGFIIQTINNSSEHYRKSPQPESDKVIEVELTLNNGEKIKQLGNSVLWTMYRGIGPSPHFLQSILMGLESYLFGLAKTGTSQSHALLLGVYDYLFTNSHSVATSAVLASVGMRYPDVVGDSILPLYSSKAIFQWEEQRYLHDRMSGLGILYDVHDLDRKESNSLPHRKLFKGLAEHVINQQLNRPFRSAIHLFLDKFHSEAENSEDVMWLKMLNEIDIRKWRPVSEPDTAGRVVMAPAYEGPVKELVEKFEPDQQRGNFEAGLSSWINDAYLKNEKQQNSYNDWRKIYLSYTTEKVTERLFARPGTLAVVGLRDFISELTDDESNWAFATIFQIVSDLLSDRNEGYHKRQIRGVYNLLDCEPCLKFLIPLFALVPTNRLKELKGIILNILLSSLHDHEINNVLYAIRTSLWQISDQFAATCFYFLIKYATAKNENRNWQKGYGEVDEETKKIFKEDLIAEAINIESISFVTVTLDLNNYTNWYMLRAFSIIPGSSTVNPFIDFSIDLVLQHIASFKDGRDDISGNFIRDRFIISDLFPEMILYLDHEKSRKIADTLFEAYNSDGKYLRHFDWLTKKQEFVSQIVKHLILAIDNKVGNRDEIKLIENFWAIWKYLHKKNIDSGKFNFASLLLLEISWKDDARNWKPLGGQKTFLMDLILYYGKEKLSSALALLTTIGNETLMPEGIQLIAAILNGGVYNGTDLIKEIASRFTYDSYYKFGKTIKQHPPLLNDYIRILDSMVNMGSSDAYLIRENMITFKVA